jgi:hypothetical protein
MGGIDQAQDAKKLGQAQNNHFWLTGVSAQQSRGDVIIGATLTTESRRYLNWSPVQPAFLGSERRVPTKGGVGPGQDEKAKGESGEIAPIRSIVIRSPDWRSFAGGGHRCGGQHTLK